MCMFSTFHSIVFHSLSLSKVWSVWWHLYLASGSKWSMCGVVSPMSHWHYVRVSSGYFSTRNMTVLTSNPWWVSYVEFLMLMTCVISTIPMFINNLEYCDNPFLYITCKPLAILVSVNTCLLSSLYGRQKVVSRLCDTTLQYLSCT